MVAGIRTPVHLSELAKIMPKAYEQLEKVRATLRSTTAICRTWNSRSRDGKLYMLQTRTGKRTPAATFRIAMDMANEKLITKEEAIVAHQVRRHRAPVLPGDRYQGRPEVAGVPHARHGINAVPGAAVGKMCFSADEAEEWAAHGEKVILVRRETSPEDVGGMAVAQGILTATGGKTSHAAVVARGWGKCCIVGAETLDIDSQGQDM